jgi:hypothetical protein
MEPLKLDKWSLVQWKTADIPISFIWTIIFFDGAFEFGDGSFIIKYVSSIRVTNTTAEKYPRLYINVFIFRICNMG